MPAVRTFCPMLTGLGARVHLFVRPADRERFTALFSDVLGCEVRELDFGMAHPILLVTFHDGSAFSAEFGADAPQLPEPVSYAHALRGAWIEFRTADLPGVLRRLDEAGVPHFAHPASPHRYFCAPNGQVFRILDVSYKGP